MIVLVSRAQALTRTCPLIRKMLQKFCHHNETLQKSKSHFLKQSFPPKLVSQKACFLRDLRKKEAVQNKNDLNIIFAYEVAVNLAVPFAPETAPYPSA